MNQKINRGEPFFFYIGWVTLAIVILSEAPGWRAFLKSVFGPGAGGGF